MIAKVSDLPADLQMTLADRDLIVFDGECVVCSGSFRFMTKHDREQRFSFALAQSELGSQIYAALDLSAGDFETNIVVVDERIYGKLGAFSAAMRVIGWPWRVLGLLSYVPKPIGDPVYCFIARNRYRIFGRYDACILPNATIRNRFVDAGWKSAD